MSAIHQLNALLQPGIAWARRPASALQQVLTALAVEFDRFEARVVDALEELLPTSATELAEDIVDLMGVEGLGTLDPDGSAGPFVVARRAIHAHLTSTSLSRARLRDLGRIYSATGSQTEFVEATVTDVDEVTITMGGDPNAELQAAAAKEPHATATLLWIHSDFVVDELTGSVSIQSEVDEHDSTVEEVAA